MSELCLFCDRDAVAYCDAPVGFGIVGYSRIGLVSENRFQALKGSNPDGSIDMFTCDAPMCAEHRKAVGHICGADPETIDWCPLHEDGKRDAPPITADEAATIRRKLHSLPMRRRMKPVTTP